jgi:hypothetical protein
MFLLPLILGASLARANEVAAIDALIAIRHIPTVELDCGGFPACLGDRMYYNQASVDEKVAAALEQVPGFLRAGRKEQAAGAISAIRGSVLYYGDRLVPRRVPLYPQSLVDYEVSVALAALRAP